MYWTRLIDFIKSLGPIKIYVDAFWELILSSIISTVPLWGLYISLSLNEEVIFQMERFYKLIENGELFIYAASTLAPVIYLVHKERSNNLKFPGHFLFTSLTVIIAVFSALIIAIQRGTKITLTENWLDISLWLFLISIVILYIVLVINNRMLPDPSGMFRASEDDYFKHYNSHRNQ